MRLKRRFTLGLVVFVLGASSSVVQAQDSESTVLASTLDDFSWLLGGWQRTTSRGHDIEHWTKTSNNTWEGLSTSTVGDLSRISEYLRLEQFGEEIFYTAKPSHNPMPTAFKLVAASSIEAVFHNPDHDFPQKISYRRVGNDSLVVRIEGLNGGEPQSIDFKFERVPNN